MKRISFTILVALFAFSQIMADTYENLWKQAADVRAKDLPRSELALMRRIIAKASTDNSYGQLMAAELRSASLLGSISADSISPAVNRLETQLSQEQDGVKQAILHVVLGKLYEDNCNTIKFDDDEYLEKGVFMANTLRQDRHYEQALAHPELLAVARSADYVPLVKQEIDGASFNHDMLHVVGFAINTRKAYQLMHDLYLLNGNRGAACLSAYKITQMDREADVKEVRKSKYLQTIDSLIHVYQDIPEAGELAVEHYRFMEGATDASAADKMKYINYALNNWGGWSRMNELRNAQKSLTNPMFESQPFPLVLRPGQRQWLVIDKVRNVQSLTLHISRLNITADNDYDVNDKVTYKMLKGKTSELHQLSQTKRFYGLPNYAVAKDSFEIAGLREGAYLLEVASDNVDVPVSRQLFYVSDLALMVQQLPNDEKRYVVVNATTGQPIAGAQIRLTDGEETPTKGKKHVGVLLTTDENGEAITAKSGKDCALVTTATDKYLPAGWMWLYRQRYYEQQGKQEISNIYTDRAIYRPGQTVHATVVQFATVKGLDAKPQADKELKLALRDANYKIVAEQNVKTDAYGTASADFQLPDAGLTGRYAIQVQQGNGSCYFRVEEYKRPTFEVTFPQVNQKYTWGDTVVVRAAAKTYAGVPVQDAKVSYRVVRRSALWWRMPEPEMVVYKGEGVTQPDGTFAVEIPLVATTKGNDADEVAFLRQARFFHFDVDATVTDQGGESHEGSMSIPLGTKPTAFSVNLPQQMEQDSLRSMTFSYCNNAGMDIAGTVRYRVDEGEWNTAATNQEIDIRNMVASLKSGEHHLYAICERDTINQVFTLFSLADTHPASHVTEWHYQTSEVFPRDGKPVYVQVGSSENGVHIVYSLIAGNKLLEKGTWEIGDSIVTRAFTYQPSYESGVVLNYSFVKDGKCYSRKMQIERPLPDKRLCLTWNTFRNRLTPGQKEEWTLHVATPDGKPAKAQLMSVLYDKSLDQMEKHLWSMNLGLWQSLPSCNWKSSLQDNSFQLYGAYPVKYYESNRLLVDYFRFNDLVEVSYPVLNEMVVTGRVANSKSLGMMKSRGAVKMKTQMAARMESADAAEPMAPAMGSYAADTGHGEDEGNADAKVLDNVQMRENLSETAFFYPAMETDDKGNVGLRFTLPESVTTWRFMGLAHDKEMRNGLLTGEAVAQKTVMVQPNMPRFLREGDKASIVARLFNTSDNAVGGTVRMQLIDPETEKVIWQKSQKYDIDAKGTKTVAFSIPNLEEGIYINKVVAAGSGYSDGEQHYLPVISNRELVTSALPFTLHEQGVKQLDLSSLFKGKNGKAVGDGEDAKLTVEYTDNPSWLMIQALPSVSNPDADNAISLMSAIYSNMIARHLMAQSPAIKQVVALWKQEKTSGKGGSALESALESNQQLKNLVLSETPWMLDADKESEQKRQLINYFDESLIGNRLSTQISKLQGLQNRSNGSFSWWKGMEGSRYITTAVTKMMARLHQMLGTQESLSGMFSSALRYLDAEASKEVKRMKELEARHETVAPSESALDYLYILSLDGGKRKGSVAQNADYLLRKMAGETANFTIYGKAMAAVVLGKMGYAQKADEYLQSVMEYAVYKEEMGRYFDTSKAYYSWSDYKIPTQVAAIEALQMKAKKEHTAKVAKEIEEMQRWLLQAKRTQAWDVPVHAVDAVYAFMNGQGQVLARSAAMPSLKLDGKQLALPKATVGLGYVKVTKSGKAKTLVVDKQSSGTSWGAVYAQYIQDAANIAATNAGLSVKRLVLMPTDSLGTMGKAHPAMGSKVTVKLIVEADRDYDFVQLVDKRAACLEPVDQLSGYRWELGCYVAPKDNATCYYFSRMAKGTHVITADYYVDRQGEYHAGTCSVQCAYSPAFGGRAEAYELEVKE